MKRSLRLFFGLSFVVGTLVIRLNAQSKPPTVFEQNVAKYNEAVAAQKEATSAQQQIGRYQIVQVTVTNLTTKEQTPRAMVIFQTAASLSRESSVH